MCKKISLLIAVLTWVTLAGAQNEYRLTYIQEFSGIAIREMERAGIPASIKLAQAILESDAGRSNLARRANNHFGIKCGNTWNGRKVYKEDDDFDERGRIIESCFRVYRNPDASFIAHSEFLRDPNKVDRYGFLFRLNPMDYRRWAVGLKRAGYATSANYHTKLINIIETYELYKYDQMSTSDLIADVDFSEDGFLTLNDVKYVLASEDETVSEIARRTDTTLRRLIKYNEELDDAEQRLGEGTKVYIQRKRCAYRGKKTWHYVQEGESVFEISQRYGVRLNKLYRRNRLEKGQQPANNERIKLRGGKVDKRPTLRGEETEEIVVPELIFQPEEEEETIVPVGPPRDTIEEVEIPEREPIVPENRPTPVEEEDPLEEEIPFEIEPQRPARPVPPPEEEEEQTEETPAEPVVPEVEEEERFEPTQPAQPTRPADNPPAGANYHTVETGDTLWSISQRYGTTVEAIVELNGLESYVIKVGQRLRVK